MGKTPVETSLASSRCTRVPRLNFSHPYAYVSTYQDVGMYAHHRAENMACFLSLALKDPRKFADTLQTKHGFHMKGTGPLEFHLGAVFYRNAHGVLSMAPKKYIERMVGSYERMFGEKPKDNMYSPLEKGDHLELDTSKIFDEQGIQNYQSLIGSLQWAILLGR